MGEWKEKKLGDLLRIKHGYAFAGEHIVTDDNGKVLVTPGNFAIGGGWKPSYKKYYSGEFPEDYILGEGDLVVTMTDLSKEVDTLGYSARIPKDDRRTFLHNQRIGLVTDISDEADPDFMYWVMRSAEYRASIVGTASGSTVSHTSPSRIYEYVFDCPDLPEQRAIASVLSSLDAKIDLLHRQNKTLEAMAETLFRQWFVEEAEAGWEEVLLSDLVEVRYGKDHKALGEGSIPVYGSGGVMRYADRALFEGESVLIPRKGSLNNVMYVNEAFWTVDTMFFTEMKRPNLAKFIYHFMKTHDLAAMNVGSAVPSMTTAVLNNMPLQIPGPDVFAKYETTIGPIYAKHAANTEQITSLTKLRETLLPKLMSGEVRVEMNSLN